MPIFSIEKGMLREIFEHPIRLEKVIQRLVEGNMHAIFGIEFVASEFELNALRLLLCSCYS